MSKVKYDFGGLATKFNVLCEDGKILDSHSCDACDGMKVPLMWQHGHNDPTNVLGHAILEKRDDGMYCKCKFNDTEKAHHMKDAIRNGDVDSLSIYANKLSKDGNLVKHATIREVSLVIAGANPGASIDYVRHSINEDGELIIEHYVDDSNEAIIKSGEYIDNVDFVEEDNYMEHNVNMTQEQLEDTIAHAVDKAMSKKDKTLQDVIDTFNDEQKQAFEISIAAAIADTEKRLNKKSVKHSAIDEEVYDETDEDVYDEIDEDVYDEIDEDVYDEIDEDVYDETDEDIYNENEENNYDYEEEEDMQHNVFDKNNNDVICHDALREEVMDTFHETKKNFKDIINSQEFLAHAAADGITNISNLFPEPKNIDGSPFILEKDAAWVADMMADISKQPFGRIKGLVYNISEEAARAKGYIKGSTKNKSQFEALRRVTNPTIVYARADLDKQDILEITDFNVVALLKSGLDVVLKNEVCQQILFSDMRAASSADKIDNNAIRPIAFDNSVYTIREVVTLSDTATEKTIVDTLRKAAFDGRKDYRGSGSPKMYICPEMLNSMMLAQDGMGRDLYETEDKLAGAFRVKKLVEVPQMAGATFTEGEGAEEKTYKVLAIIVNLKDYKVGAVKGGEISRYEQFDININQMKYLTETFISGTLVMPKSAIVIVKEVTTTALG